MADICDHGAPRPEARRCALFGSRVAQATPLSARPAILIDYAGDWRRNLTPPQVVTTLPLSPLSPLEANRFLCTKPSGVNVLESRALDPG